MGTFQRGDLVAEGKAKLCDAGAAETVHMVPAFGAGGAAAAEAEMGHAHQGCLQHGRAGQV
ncbi:hypothetical protein A4R35_09210 [Thermogemmatispora tikiterensis]|uniref:Uncharacterized protein n=1 Tax=Thermogemmatispora tikiterensis TaxID=1825093 RepID=A0A328VFV3_9CHLR|nr:hypothetical protein A4R35_09210 [Thermogemmatispora tikiterensis]